MIELFARFLLQSGMTAMRDSLIERLQIVERRLGLVLRRRGEMLVDPLVRGFPRLGPGLAKVLREIFPQQRMRVERNERAASVAIDGDELGVGEALRISDLDVSGRISAQPNHVFST